MGSRPWGFCFGALDFITTSCTIRQSSTGAYTYDKAN
nr:MAG TPA: hypothetical protein [Caudoviricetes sp.]